MREEKIRQLIALIERHEDIGEIEYFSSPLGIQRLRVSRKNWGVAVAASPAPVSAPAGEAPATRAAEPVEGMHEVTAPMVGTFYRAPSPSSEPFVREGSKVQPGTVLCIIEAMKLMNEIESGVSGTVREILAENGSPIEYGQAIMLIEED